MSAWHYLRGGPHSWNPSFPGMAYGMTIHTTHDTWSEALRLHETFVKEYWSPCTPQVSKTPRCVDCGQQRRKLL
eukprot:NODE_16655_length_984_cov_4.162194.p3 GENE.NODE_16655_length_984_cov_4.162194~~NODE_16655_length_984_cov_4.162194.p3  ORF type:complete len:74 (+),score=1.41 NODE_16655_length_984_cov_4.162194:230-451(+)